MPEKILEEQHGYKNREAYWKRWVEENGPEAVAKKLLELEHNSEHDKLTGLLNRRGLEERILSTAFSVGRRASILSFLFIDVDGLKKINDSEGHKIGDKAIMQVADAIKIRGYDIAGRWGGDEFLVILPDTNQDDALLVVNKIKNNLHGALTTVSIGVGVWDGIKEPLETINEADRSMNLLKISDLARGERSKGIGVVTLE